MFCFFEIQFLSLNSCLFSCLHPRCWVIDCSTIPSEVRVCFSFFSLLQLTLYDSGSCVNNTFTSFLWFSFHRQNNRPECQINTYVVHEDVSIGTFAKTWHPLGAGSSLLLVIFLEVCACKVWFLLVPFPTEPRTKQDVSVRHLLGRIALLYENLK